MQYRTTSYAAHTFDTFYFEKNLQGDIIAVYNASGTKIGSYIYDAWGNCTASVVSGNTVLENNIVRTLNPFRYRGYYYDTETGLYYLQSRYYNPAWGRFLNADGYISTGTGLLGYNMYTYCDNDPIMKADVSGYRGEEKKYFDYDDPFDLLPECLEGGIGSSYSLYATRSGVAAYDANLLGYYSSGVTSAVQNPRYYIVPGAVTVTDDMVTYNVPVHAKKVAEYVKNHNGSPPPKYKGGKFYANDGRGGSQLLPSDYEPYREYDVHPHIKGQNRGCERIVIGLNGQTYYTGTHYRTFIRME